MRQTLVRRERASAYWPARGATYPSHSGVVTEGAMLGEAALGIPINERNGIVRRCYQRRWSGPFGLGHRRVCAIHGRGQWICLPPFGRPPTEGDGVAHAHSRDRRRGASEKKKRSQASTLGRMRSRNR
eukprot:scaffold19308_cov170-Isochrysis_galbana.AAC.4